MGEDTDEGFVVLGVWDFLELLGFRNHVGWIRSTRELVLVMEGFLLGIGYHSLYW